jgi:hypothetical protein
VCLIELLLTEFRLHQIERAIENHQRLDGGFGEIGELFD